MSNMLGTQKSKFNGETVTKLLIYTICSTAIVTASILLSKSCLFSSAAANESYHPTSIPWLKTKFDCEDSGRHWENNQCWDEEHNAVF